ncbi:MAG TPA: GAF domain-containing sensor histidine kinase [Polyangiaceae bacterium]|nr:GAF domain-containing sensor histidine kinase [Polyangiaceae bacterium]
MSSEVEPKTAALGDERSARLADALRREQRISRALREVGTALGTTLDLDDLLELILAKITELLEADRATLYLLDEAKDELVSRMVVGGEVRSIRMKVGHGIAGLVAKSGESLRVADAYRDERFEKEWDLLSGYRTTSMLATPLRNHLGRTIGVLQVLNKRAATGFTQDDEAIASALSTQAAVAIDNSRLVLSLIQKNRQLIDTKEQLERKFRELSLLFELERATARATSIEELVTVALEQAAGASDSRGALLRLADDETGDLVDYLHDRDAGGELSRHPAKSGEGLLGRAMRENEPIVLLGAALQPAAAHLPFSATSALALLLEGEEGALGAIAVFSSGDDRLLGDTDVGLLRLVAANVATAVRLFNASRARERGERLTSIGRLLSQVIHDFKSPMTVISGYVQLMADAEERTQRQEYSELVLKQFDVLTGMQREVLEFARGDRAIFVRRVFLKKFFGELERQLRIEVTHAGGGPIELKTQVDSKLTARFDEARVARALHNLARNAIEAMREKGGTLTIAGELRARDLAITVSDTGPGIPKEIEGRLFQSFVTAGKKGGTGLGLAIVKKIAEEHGGRVDVESSKAGSRFTLVLPQAKPGSSPSQGERAHGPA